MRIALCLHGYMENAGGMTAFYNGYSYINKKLLRDHDVDIFTHSWDIENKREYEKFYGEKTVNSTFQPQINFAEKGLCKNQKWFDEEIDRSSLGDLKNNTIERTLSFLYSRQKAIQLKNKFEEENNFEYDCTVLARFDLGQRGKHCPQKYYATDFNFLRDSDMTKLHCAFWDQFNHGIPDHWFYSNSANMKVIGDLYDFAFGYYQTDSDYVHSCLNGWIESNSEDEFSNEMLKETKSEKLVTWPRHMCIDNHKLYKWHINKNKLPLELVDIT